MDIYYKTISYAIIWQCSKKLTHRRYRLYRNWKNYWAKRSESKYLISWKSILWDFSTSNEM